MVRPFRARCQPLETHHESFRFWYVFFVQRKINQRMATILFLTFSAATCDLQVLVLDHMCNINYSALKIKISGQTCRKNIYNR